jgi:hypothetical protein
MRGYLGLALACAPLAFVLLASCDGDDTVAPNPGRGSGNDATVVDTGAGGDGSTTNPNALCNKYGGFATVQGYAKAIVDGAKADCKIGAYFTGLALTDEKHLEDCLAIQIGEIMQCDGKVYAGSKDGLGQDCRPMDEAHQQVDPQIRQADFDAFVIDVIAALKAKGMATGDIPTVSTAFNQTQGDVVQSNDPGNAQSTCPGADAGQDTGLDDAGQDTGIADANDAG